MFYDPELPSGCQDADIEMADAIAQGNSIAKLRKKGVCIHSGHGR